MSTGIEQRIEDVITKVLRPLVQADGGDLRLSSCDETTVILQLTGSCKGCAGRPYTIARIVEPALRTVVGPGVTIEVEPG